MLKVIADATRADAQQANLARFFLSGGIAGGWLQLGLEVLRQPDADGLLWIAARIQCPPGRIDDAGEFLRNSCPWRILIADLRRSRMPSSPWQKQTRAESHYEGRTAGR